MSGEFPAPPRARRPASRFVALLAGVCLGWTDPCHGADAAADGPESGSGAAVEVAGARVRVSGFWFVKNRKLRELLTVLEPEGQALPVLDAAFIEDSVLVLQSALMDEGYLNSSGSVRLELKDGAVRTDPWTSGALPELPRDIAAVAAEFRLEPGLLYYVDSLQFEGLTSVGPEEARAYFVNDGSLLGGRKAHKYTPDGIDQGCKSLQVKLRRFGRADATVVVEERTIDETTGAVVVRVRVDEGPIHRIGSIHLEGELPEEAREQIELRVAGAGGLVYSPLVRQDLLQQIHVDLYEHGYAEARVRILNEDTTRSDDGVVHSLSLVVEPGSLIRVGEVRFAGDEKTRTTILRRATESRPGQIFDRNRVEADRLSLSNLGAFAAVRAEVEKKSADLWDLVYQLRPSKRMEVGVLAGYGSYEKLRGGLELFHANQFGRAERGRLQIIESTKSASAEYQLTIPQIFGTTAQANARAFGLDREEVSFDRREAGVSTGVRRHFERLGADVAARYQYESLRADNVVPDLQEAAPENSNVGALTFDISQDRRDNPLTPKGGYELSLALETAARVIGSDVDYQKIDLKASWHSRVGRSFVLHAGVRHGAIWTFGDAAGEIPINKRFFPGGDSTVRGYSEGTAGPRGDTGENIGAEVSTIVNVELEAALVDKVYALVFVDTGVTGDSIDDYPGDEVRVSAGVGLRYNSLIGPVRLEYGYNIVRETGDQSGQLHFSLGFPF